MGEPNRVRIGVTAIAADVETAVGRVPARAIQQSFLKALSACGAVPIVLVPVSPGQVGELIDAIDGLVLPGGTDLGSDPERDELELALARAAVARELPVLGVCRGMQVLNVALGGTLISELAATVPDGGRHRDVADAGAPCHDVVLDERSVLASVVASKTLRVNSIHCQGVGGLGAGLRAVGRHPGGEVIEAVEHESAPFCVGVQWHPELLEPADQPAARPLFTGLVAAARRGVTR